MGVGDVMYSMLTPINGRMLMMGWVLTARSEDANGWHMSPGPADCLTVPREVTFDAIMSQLLVMPTKELSSLRGQMIGSRGTVVLTVDKSLALLETNSTAFDLELTFMLSASELAVQLAPGGLVIGINVTSGEERHVSLSVDSDDVVFTFALPPHQKTLAVRALCDRNVVEVFVANGRGVFTGAANALESPGAFVLARRTVTMVSAKAWEMGCGWEVDDPVGSGTATPVAKIETGVHQNVDATIVVRPSAIIADISEAMNGAGMEELNHEIYGGIYSQLIHGESFEEPSGLHGVSGEGFINRGNPTKSDDGNTSYITWQAMPTAFGMHQSGCRFSVNTTVALNGNQSQRIGCEGSTCSCSLLNRGVDAIVSARTLSCVSRPIGSYVPASVVVSLLLSAASLSDSL